MTTAAADSRYMRYLYEQYVHEHCRLLIAHLTWTMQSDTRGNGYPSKRDARERHTCIDPERKSCQECHTMFYKTDRRSKLNEREKKRVRMNDEIHVYRRVAGRGR